MKFIKKYIVFKIDKILFSIYNIFGEYDGNLF